MKLSEKKKAEFGILYESLIGCDFKIVSASNDNLVGISGELVLESVKLFYIRVSDGSVKKVLKAGCVVEIAKEGVSYRVIGDALLGTLVARIKKIK